MIAKRQFPGIRSNMTNLAVPQHLARLVEWQAERHPERDAYRFLTDEGETFETISFRDLFHRVSCQAAVLGEFVSPGDRVLLMAPTEPEFIQAFLACSFCGAVAVPVFPPKRADHGPEIEFLRQVARSTAAKVFLTSSAQIEILSENSVGAEFMKDAETLSLEALAVGAGQAALRSSQWCSSDPALILFTSGSTGDPKGVVLSHENLVWNFSAFCNRFELGVDTPICTWLPNSHIAGLYTRLLGLLSTSPTICFSLQGFLNQPSLWLSTLSKYQVHMSAAPNFAYELCANLPQDVFSERLNLRSWRMAISGGEVVQPATVSAFCRRFQEAGFMRSSFLPYFGMTETLCTTIPGPVGDREPQYFDRDAIAAGKVRVRGEGSAGAIALISNGELLADTEALIVDPQSKTPLEGSAIGELWLRGKSLTLGYWGQDRLSESVCRAAPDPDDGKRYFRTGDLGFFLDGELFLTGRLKDLLIVNGKNYYPTDIEASIGEAFGQEELAAVAVFPVFHDGSEQLGLAIETEMGSENPRISATIEKIREVVLRRHGLSVGSFVSLPIGAIPRTRSGKLQRSECRRRLLDGIWASWKEGGAQLGAPDSSLSDSMIPGERELIRLLATELPAGTKLTSGMSLDSLGIDSISAVRVITKIFQRMRVKVDYSVFASAQTIGELAIELQGESTSSAGNKAAEIDYRAQLSRVDLVMDQASESIASGDAIFLTGATGFLGGYLLRDLLLHTNRKVVCLVRAGSASAGRERLAATLENLGWNEIIKPDRLEVVCGSLDKPLLGLEVSTFARLANELGVVIHNGANVNFVAPFEALRDVNVESNLEILRLATQSVRKAVHFVSTIGVFNGPDRDQFNPIREGDWIPNPNRLFSGYSQSKWVAESMFQRARERGMPVRTYRPGLVMGDSQTGYCHTDDFLCRFLKGCLQMGVFPDLPLELDMTPVDFVSRSISTLVQQGAEDGKTFHLINPSPISIPALSRWLKTQGYSSRLEPSDLWHQRLTAELPEGNALFPLVPFLLQELPGCQETILPFFSERGLNLDTGQTREALAGTDLACPPVDSLLLQRYLEFFWQIGFLPMPETSKSTPLTTALIP